MINIPLQDIPNQSLSIQLKDNNVDIRLHTCASNAGTPSVTITITINENLIVNNVRIVPSTKLINYFYLENGNFYFLTENDDYPDYNLFGISQFLIFASTSELEAIRNAAIT
jgi:hypothetical protein